MPEITQTDLDVLASVITKSFTPFAVTCIDPKCNCKDEMRDTDWARYYQMRDIVEFLTAGTALRKVKEMS